MDRRDLLKGLGAAGLASILPAGKSRAVAPLSPSGGCVLIPGETAGPFPLDLSSDPDYFRVDITEGYPGLPLDLYLTVVNVNDGCAPITNARVDIWHCNKDGYYSGFVNAGYLGTQDNSGATFCRGIQLTDSNGLAHFQTIYPGWYPGRVTHIHFQVFLTSVLSATSQMCFPEAITDDVGTDPLYSPHGQDPLTNATDPGVFQTPAGEYVHQLLEIIPNGSGYDGYLTIGIDAPSTGIINLEPETGGQFKLWQNVPNPFSDETVIPFELVGPSHVLIELFDLNAKKVAVVVSSRFGAGEQRAALRPAALGLGQGNYVYQISVTNENGTFRQCKMLTFR